MKVVLKPQVYSVENRRSVLMLNQVYPILTKYISIVKFQS